MRRKTRIALGATAIAAALVLGGCSNSSEVAADAQDSDGGTLTIAQISPVISLDPAMYRNRVTQTVVRNVFEALVNQDESLAPVPELATGWEEVNDTTWRFTLREDVTFHNGEPFTAEAVKYSIDRVIDPAQESPRASMLSMITNVEIEDDYTVLITTEAPAPTLLANLAVNEIVPPEYVEEAGDAEFAANPIGTGPFTFESSADSGGRVILTSNEDYWGGAPRIDRLIFETIPEVSSRIAALQSGAVDIATNVPADLASTLTGDVEPVSVNGTRIAFLALNTTAAPFDDVEVRRAMNTAVDKDAIVDGLYLGFAETLNQPAFPQMIGYDESFSGYEFDLEGARSVLSEISESVTVDATEADRMLAEAVVGQLRAAGLDATVRVLEALAFDESTASGASQAYISSWGAAEADVDVIFARHFWSETRESTFDTGYSNPAVDDLIVAARSTLDTAEREDLYSQAIELVMDDAPWVPLLTAEEIYGVSTNVNGWEPSPIGRINAKTTTVN